MGGGYLTWQFGVAPIWLIELGWNWQRVLFRFFSVPIMAKTLVAHWHRDAVSYERGGLGGMALAFAWNLISRGIGLLIRVVTLTMWLAAAAALLLLSAGALALFMAWPWLMVGGFLFGLGSLLLP